ncbi:MAG: hypothetical protein Q9201_001125 [Fulgogasparrea decipioides]
MGGPPRATSIKEAVASSTACTPATVSDLKSLLFPEKSSGIAQSTKRNAVAHSSKPHVSGSARGGRVRARKQPEVTVLESQEDVPAPTSIADRQKLATEVINTVLKAFTEVVRSQSSPQGLGRKGRVSSPNPPSNAGSPNIARHTQDPLQPICVNRVVSERKQRENPHKSARSAGTKAASGRSAQAECAILALEALRTSHVHMAPEKGLPSFQLESAMSTLISKLIALGLCEPALRELRILRQSLLVASGEVGKADRARHKHVASKGKVSDLLILPCTNINGTLLALLVTFQLQVVKLIAANRDASCFEAAIEHLQSRTPYSPINLIQAQKDPSDPQAAKKVANQLESLSRTILSICPSRSTSEGQVDFPRLMDPLTALRFQLLALELRSLWWTTAGHEGSVSKDLLEPFSLYLAAFRHRCTTGSDEGYRSAKSCLANLSQLNQSANRASSTSMTSNEAWHTIFLGMAEIARDTTLHQETSIWLEKCIESPIDAAVSPCQRCTIICKRAITCAQLPGTLYSEDKTVKAFHNVQQSIEGNLNGEPEELDELLLVIIRLRKTAASMINKSRGQPDSGREPPSPKLIQQCFRICLASVKFLNRYIGVKPPQSEKHELIQRYKQRALQASAVAKPFIDTVVSIARFSKGESADWWIRSEAGLRECLGLASATMDTFQATMKNKADANPISSAILAVSNAYWSRYMHLKQSKADLKASLEALKASIDAVDSCPLVDKLAAGLHTRLEHYAQSLETARDYGGAAEYYSKAINMHIEAGVLQRAATAAATLPLTRLFARDSEYASLGRSLAAYPRSATQTEPETAPSRTIFDDEGLDFALRGVALEHQLASLVSQPTSNSITPRVDVAIRYLAAMLLSVYSEQSFPIRRLRVVETLMWLKPTRLEAPFLDSVDKAFELKTKLVSDELLGSDLGLQLMLPHLDASRDAISAIEEKCLMLKQQKLETAFSNWYHLFEQCPDLGAVEARVGDASIWLLHLELLGQYLDAYGLGQQRLTTLHLCIIVREKVFPTQTEALALNLTQSGLQYLQLGYPNQAGMIFRKAQKYVNKAELTSEVAVLFYLGYAKYFLATDNTDICKETLARAREIFENSGKEGQAIVAHDRNRLYCVMADVNALCSDLAARRGDPFRALLYAHQSLRCMQKAWKNIERRQTKARMDEIRADGKDRLEGLIGSMSKATILDHTPNGKSSPTCGQAAVFWPLVPQLHRAFLQVAQLYGVMGIFKEASHYLERSQTFAEAASASGLLNRSLSYFGGILTRSEDYAGANSIFERAHRCFRHSEKTQEFTAFQLNLATYHLKKGQTLAAEQTCDIAGSTLQRLMATDFIDQILHNKPNIDALQEQLSALTVGEIASDPPGNRKCMSTNRSSTKAPPFRKGTGAAAADTSDIETSSSALVRLQRDVVRQRAVLALQQGKLEQASELLAQATSQYCTPQETVLRTIIRAEISIKRGLNSINSDPVFCILPESTISIPSVSPVESSAPLDRTEEPVITARKRSVKRDPVVTRGKKTQAAAHLSGDTLCHDFRRAQMDSSRVYQLANAVCPTASLHHLSKVMAETLLRLSALSLSSPQESLKPSPNSLLLIADAARTTSVLRGKLGAEVEKTLLKDQELLAWPDEHPENTGRLSLPDFTPDIEALQERYNDIIPPSWQVLTMSLSRSRGEILVSRIRHGQNPFILSLPLDRHSSREGQDESFGYGEAKTELEEIIALADQSTHDTQVAPRKGARAAWWEGRAALDARLKDLLKNMGNIWFGGFQGMFSQQLASPALLSRFHQSLKVALDNHLPSRRGLGKRQQPQQTSLDARVIELFVALGDLADFSDIEEPLMDLLYFVIDILQFRGERNAYDEIDFDSMAIEIIDALRQYHEAAKNIDNRSSIQHTVLVLDKELHCFPWESLPCLDGQAVTRLPSLSCLRDRIQQQQQQQQAEGVESADEKERRYCINGRNGAYVLNPAGDLESTQAKFEGPLSKMSEWEGLSASEPSEDQLKGYLQERDIFLYFGHGSGSQYIRSKTVQKLDKCAVALLMGCSSGKLTEAGEFEPYGTPMSYMQAGCPAMLATLWDVTDKDIDRFSETVLQKWGLFQSGSPPDDSPVKKTTQPKGKNKARQSPPPRADSGSVSLDQAVAEGRGSCIFRYLNGAAPVVYGVPVFLS